jgi:protoheme ferro-lyase
MSDGCDALLIVSFGGPEGMDDVMPFLENVVRGRNVRRERLLGVAQHYEMFGGVSPINRRAERRVACEWTGASDLLGESQLVSVVSRSLARDGC